MKGEKLCIGTVLMVIGCCILAMFGYGLLIFLLYLAVRGWG